MPATSAGMTLKENFRKFIVVVAKPKSRLVPFVMPGLVPGLVPGIIPGIHAFVCPDQR